MASDIPLTKQLRDLTETEAIILLEEMKFKNISETLLSGNYGKVTGELLMDLDDATLQSIGIQIPLQRKQFLKSMKEYKDDGIPSDQLRTAEINKTQLPFVAKPSQGLGESPRTPIRNETKLYALLNKSQKITEACTEEMDIYAYPEKKIQVKHLQKPLYGTN